MKKIEPQSIPNPTFILLIIAQFFLYTENSFAADRTKTIEDSLSDGFSGHLYSQGFDDPRNLQIDFRIQAKICKASKDENAHPDCRKTDWDIAFESDEQGDFEVPAIPKHILKKIKRKPKKKILRLDVHIEISLFKDGSLIGNLKGAHKTYGNHKLFRPLTSFVRDFRSIRIHKIYTEGIEAFQKASNEFYEKQKTSNDSMPPAMIVDPKYSTGSQTKGSYYSTGPKLGREFSPIPTYSRHHSIVFHPSAQYFYLLSFAEHKRGPLVYGYRICKYEAFTFDERDLNKHFVKVDYKHCGNEDIRVTKKEVSQDKEGSLAKP